ncbi:hypothetical protein LRC484719_30480 [Mycobacterium riyadhense]|uniref:JmjC domain-containing protein n=2 Tax=Mycobacterium riyadhense TaxID=486698 RepID=A0A653ED83_9MYCO|nr:hypothetical protein BIN_B_00972 [Mycobacterium riyadhense]
MPLWPNGSTVWNALESAPPGARLCLTVDGVSERSTTAVREVVANAANIDDLCNKSNESLTLYAMGVNQWHPALVQELCSAYGEAIWDQGLTDGTSRCDIFAGKYSSTPGGIHREPCWNRHLVVQGQKRFYFWDHDDVEASGAYDSVETYPTKNGDEQYLAKTSILDIGSSAMKILTTPGHYVQWPNWVWHVAETPSASLAVNIASYGSSSTGTIRSLPIHRSNDGEVSAEWVAQYREFNPELRTSDLMVLVAAVSSNGLICPRLRISGDIQEVRSCSAVCRIMRAPSVWVRHGDGIIVGLGGQATFISANGEEGARWLGSGTFDPFLPKARGDFELVEWLYSIGSIMLK